MEGKNMSMQDIFSKLSEQNKDIVILIARSIKVAQEVAEQPRKPPMQMAQSQKQDIVWKNCS